MTQIPVLDLPADPRTAGRLHGERLREGVASNAREYRIRIRVAGLDDAGIDRRSREFVDRVAEYDPGYREAMEGISEGSGVDLVDVAMVNARYELLYTTWSEFGRPTAASLEGECTSFGGAAEAFEDGEIHIGQNWDWFPQIEGAWVRWEKDGVRALGFTEAGIAGAKIGINSEGLGVCLMGLGSSEDDWRIAGMPVHMRTQRVLESRTLREAVGVVAGGRPGCSADFLIGSEEGVVNAETSPRGSLVTYQDGERPLVHANHFLEAQALGIDQSWLRTGKQSTFDRYERMSGLVGEGPVSVDGMKRAMRDHENGELSLCRHAVESDPPELWSTTAMSVQMNLTRRELEYTWGTPCDKEYERIAL
ncbi:C45 family autoproteolytic acyltransferase/hydolase [Salininema proteolyticum]|uniref:C45 family autoproteolytic acyltransferase/hydrolase n=1 Tax=Salininema proteolyticum TaxID=1607685 RepID=A0ABV8U4R3_9ACTN